MRTEILLVQISILIEYTWWQNTDNRTERKGQLNCSAWVSCNSTLAEGGKPVKKQWFLVMDPRGEGGPAPPQMTGSGSHDLKLEFRVFPYCVPEDLEHQWAHLCCEHIIRASVSSSPLYPKSIQSLHLACPTFLSTKQPNSISFKHYFLACVVLVISACHWVGTHTFVELMTTVIFINDRKWNLLLIIMMEII